MADGTHLVFVWTPSGYVLQEREGDLPEVGSTVEIDGRQQRVSKIGPSPYPADGRACAYLQG
jgi:hypothetical protein